MFKYTRSAQSQVTPVDVREFHLRLYRTNSLEEMYQFLNNIKEIVSFICSKEVSRNRGEHFHCWLRFEDANELLKNRQEKFRLLLKERFKISDDEKNGGYSFAIAINKKQLMKYSLKDGNYRYKNVEDDLIKALKMASNRKKDDFGQELTNLEDIYFKSKDMSIKEFYRRFIKMKVQFGQNIYPSHCDAYIYKIQFKKDERKIIEYVENRLVFMRLENGFES